MAARYKIVHYTCSVCGHDYTGRKLPDMQCQTCYHYFSNGGKVYDLPAPGTIRKDENGNIICHLCGRSFSRLGCHVRCFHNMTIDEYKEMFGLCQNACMTNDTYHEKMRQYALSNNMPEQLMRTGKNTRFAKGKIKEHRPVRLQECIDRRKPYGPRSHSTEND